MLFSGTIMGKVATIYKVYADDPNQTERIRDDIVKQMKPQSIQLEDVAFGIKVIKVMFVHEDSDGSASYEDGLRKIAGVNEVEVADESLL
jgi:translation elongation factor EF-1beta